MFVDRDEPEAEMIGRWNRVFRALSAEPRRQIVLALMEAPPERELLLPEAANPSYLLANPDELAIQLVHTHLPLLAESEFVEWHRDPLRVERGPAFEEVEIVMDSVQTRAADIPSQLVQGCQRLEERREGGRS